MGKFHSIPMITKLTARLTNQHQTVPSDQWSSHVTMDFRSRSRSQWWCHHSHNAMQVPSDWELPGLLSKMADSDRSESCRNEKKGKCTECKECLRSTCRYFTGESYIASLDIVYQRICCPDSGISMGEGVTFELFCDAKAGHCLNLAIVIINFAHRDLSMIITSLMCVITTLGMHSDQLFWK